MKSCVKKIKASNHRLFTLFDQQLDKELLEKLNNNLSIQTYLVAITPRSGSSYFTDLLKKTNKLANPGEYLNANLIPNMTTALKVNNFSDYWTKLIKQKGHKEIFGVKASFFQYLPLIETGVDNILFKNPKIILLKRKNIVKQAISLYLATESTIFHTKTEHSKKKWLLLEQVEHSDKDIQRWINHIHIQEQGWDKYLQNNDFLPLWYEDIQKNPKKCVENVLNFFDLDYSKEDIIIESVFEKLAQSKNEQFYETFLSKNQNIDFLNQLTLDMGRIDL